jgi:PIN domain nuclease of toxin-antitoxin system
VHVSIVALWELAIKAAMGRLDIFERISGRTPAALSGALRESGFDLLPIEIPHVLLAARLPLHHRDPFDRMMIAQAQEEHLTIVTRDAIFARYGVRVLAV